MNIATGNRTGRTLAAAFAVVFLCLHASLRAQNANTYYIVGTHQSQCYDDSGPIPAPQPGQPFFGQDAQHAGNRPNYHDNGNGTVTDSVTGLMWVKARGSKASWEKAAADAATCTVGGYNDWRVPTIKELYSLIDFRGRSGLTPATSTPYIDTTYFGFAYGDTGAGERVIDCQDWSATTYVNLTMAGDSTAFGVNFADGRIKGYPKPKPQTGGRMQLYVRYVRGNAQYGHNDFTDNGDSTITDLATGLEWSQPDSRTCMNWETALAWVQARNAAHWLGHDDWRLPNAKELQSIVDYTRSPATTQSAAIDPLFLVTPIDTNEYPYYWSSTTHLDNMGAVYVCFGRGLGWMQFPPGFVWRIYDVHGAGCQRSDPKNGDPANYPHGLGPQGDVIRIANFVRLVRSGAVVPVELSSFRAIPDPATGRVRLEWTTESESNNRGFLVERRGATAAAWNAVPGSFTAGHGSTAFPQVYAYFDRPPSAGEWQYRLKQIDYDGGFEYSGTVRVRLPESAWISSDRPALDVRPNPVGAAAQGGPAEVTLDYRLPAGGRIALRVYDSYGRQVACVADGERTAGEYSESFLPAELPGGIYFCSLETASGTAIRRLVLLR